jgi:hypothetical protein
LSGLKQSKSCNIVEGNYKITLYCDKVAKDILFLIRSLGYCCKMYKSEYLNLYTLLVYDKNTDTNIEVIPCGEGEYYGFTLDGNRKFLLHDCTVTHNTLSMIGLILRDKMEWDINTPFVFEISTSESGGRIRKKTIKRYDRLSTTLVLVSQSILGQWQQELSKTPLKVGSIFSKRHIDEIDPGEKDVILVTPTMYNSLISEYQGYAWKRFIFEEPGHLKISGMKEIHAGFYWFVTATPNAIKHLHSNCRRGNFMQEIVGNGGWWDFETQFEGMILRNNIDFVHSSFNMPITHYYYHECYNPIFNTVRGFVNDNIKIMIEAGNIEGAITALGGGKTGNIVELVKKKKQEEIEEIEAKIRIYTIRNDVDRIRKWEERKNTVNEQIQELDKRVQEMLNDKCHICLDSITSPVLGPCCQNIFCGECLLTWIQNRSTCPLCRTNIQPSQLIYISNNEEETKSSEIIEEKRTMTKLEKIIDIIKNTTNGKFIIFSGFDNTFLPICNILNENNISFSQIKGAVHSRQRSLNQFKNGETSVIFLNTTFEGAGINLQEATDIILYHEMSTYTQTQILGRANRIGRTAPLNVHYLQVKI